MSLNDFSLTNAVESDALFVLKDAQSVLSPRQKTEPKKVRARRLEITQLPGAMRHMGWITAARLMERWFNTPAFAMSAEQKAARNLADLPWQQVDETIVTMRWASQFERCRAAVDLARSRSFHTQKGMTRLRDLVYASGWDGTRPHSLGFYGMSSRLMDKTCQINVADLGERTDTLDEIYGALGLANLKVGVVGTALNERGKRLFKVDYLGFYILDTYDFNGPQYLGTWTDKRVLTKAETIAAGTYAARRIYEARDDSPLGLITNGDFRDYRAKTGRGGDFFVVSDIQWERINAVVDLDQYP
ncbi:hypothetical protein ABIE51_002608 [Lysobacter sp. OAE881]|uniref:DUF6402 family protein n=1 Tax=Lysobacter sp. OAE881 TaxID=2663813 RepID=UPI00178BC6FE